MGHRKPTFVAPLCGTYGKVSKAYLVAYEIFPFLAFLGAVTSEVQWGPGFGPDHPTSGLPFLVGCSIYMWAEETLTEWMNLQLPSHKPAFLYGRRFYLTVLGHPPASGLALGSITWCAVTAAQARGLGVCGAVVFTGLMGVLFCSSVDPLATRLGFWTWPLMEKKFTGEYLGSPWAEPFYCLFVIPVTYTASYFVLVELVSVWVAAALAVPCGLVLTVIAIALPMLTGHHKLLAQHPSLAFALIGAQTAGVCFILGAYPHKTTFRRQLNGSGAMWASIGVVGHSLLQLFCLTVAVTSGAWRKPLWYGGLLVAAFCLTLYIYTPFFLV